jgi:hypothetical protein
VVPPFFICAEDEHDYKEWLRVIKEESNENTTSPSTSATSGARGQNRKSKGVVQPAPFGKMLEEKFLQQKFSFAYYQQQRLLLHSMDAPAAAQRNSQTKQQTHSTTAKNNNNNNDDFDVYDLVHRPRGSLFLYVFFSFML